MKHQYPLYDFFVNLQFVVVSCRLFKAIPFSRIIPVFLFSFILISACATEKDRVVEGSFVELNYTGTAEINGGMWVEIDGHRFTHYELHDDLLQQPDALPATRVYQLNAAPETEEERQLYEPFTRLDMAIRLGHYISRLGEGESAYTISNPELLMLRGILRFSKSDGSDIEIKVPEDYPVQISVID